MKSLIVFLVGFALLTMIGEHFFPTERTPEEQARLEQEYNQPYLAR